MRKAMLGRTGLEISELALGGGVTGGILINADEATRHDALQRAVTAGINWIDTAPIYGDGASEETIGRHLRVADAAPACLHQGPARNRRHARRCRRDPAQPRSEPAAPAGPIRSRCFSCTIISATAWASASRCRRSRCSGRGGVADTFDRLKEQGLIRAGGMTAAGDTHACLDVINSGRFDAAQIYYNAINPSAAWTRVPPGWRAGRTSPGSWRPASDQNMGMLNIRVWAGGVLAKLRTAATVCS